MATDFPFLSGALFKWTSMDKMNAVQGRVFLLIQTGTGDEALEMREEMFKKPELFIELLTTMRPWPVEIVNIDTDELNKHTVVKDIFPYHPNR
jgi:hypothetical protein